MVITPRVRMYCIDVQVKLKQKTSMGLGIDILLNFREGGKMLLSRLAPRHVRRADVLNLKIVLGT